MAGAFEPSHEVLGMLGALLTLDLAPSFADQSPNGSRR